jgi:hypothetical protein
MLKRSDAAEFLAAEATEIANMVKNKVFRWVHLPAGERTITSKFVYKWKHYPDGTPDKHKARIVARGFEQREGIDYVDTSAPVAGVVGFRILVIISLIKGWKTYSWDVDAAFLHGVLDRPIYMTPPSGYSDKGEDGKVLLLEKTLYGLKQAANEWWVLLSQTFRDLGYKAVDASDCFWVKTAKGEICIACHHVHDHAVTASCDWIAFELRDTLQKKYGISDGGSLKGHLGMCIDIKDGEYAHIHQAGYIKSILKRFKMTDAKPVKTPMCDSIRISLEDSPKEIDVPLRQQYMEMVGSLNYLSYMTRPDITFACSQLGTVLQNPGEVHLQATKRVLRYLAGTPDLWLFYHTASWKPPGFNVDIKATEITGYTDSDWAGDFDTRLSTTCYLTFMAGGPISWKAKKQKAHAGSSAEAELIAMTGGARDIVYIRSVLELLGVFKQTKTTTLRSDSSAAISIADKPGMKEKTKHIALRYFQVREYIRLGILQVLKIGTDYTPSDIGTKALGPLTFIRHLSAVVGTPNLTVNANGTGGNRDNELGSVAALAAVERLELAGWSLVKTKGH